jgi:hypothetical protein
MKLETAIKQIKQESNFLGLTVAEVMADVQKYGRMVYSERTVEAHQVVVLIAKKPPWHTCAVEIPYTINSRRTI